jgi:hypothetical protein
MTLPKRGPGRPPKFGRPSRLVTVTLPEDILARLALVDPDLGRAIVAVADSRAPRPADEIPAAELSSYGNHAIIVVTPVKALKRLPGVQLVPIGSGRSLISLNTPNSITRFEIDVRDQLERNDVDGPERRTLEAIADLLRQARQARSVTVEARTIIVFESKRQRRIDPRRSA